MKKARRFTIETDEVDMLDDSNPVRKIMKPDQNSACNEHASDLTIEKISALMTSIVREELNSWKPPVPSGGVSELAKSIDDSDPAKGIFTELAEIQEYIANSKAEIAALKPEEGEDTKFSTAKQELQQIVDATAKATNDILSESEHIVEVTASLTEKLGANQIEQVSEEISALEMSSTQIMLACGFQDLTGQRITKVVNTMIFVEERINKLMELWNIQNGTGDSALVNVRADDKRPDKDLLNGPQSEGEGISQNDIDAMFA